MGCAVTTALGLINNLAQLKIGQSVAVFGCGGVGLNVVQGALPGFGRSDHRHRYLRPQTGVAPAVRRHPRINCHERRGREVRKIAGPGRRRVRGQYRPGPAHRDGLRVDRPEGPDDPGGRARHDENIHIHSLPLHHGKVLTGCEGGDTDPAVDIPRYVRLYQRGKLPLDTFDYPPLSARRDQRGA